VLGLLIFNRPYERKSGNIINIVIQVVRALSVICILVFVEELGIAQTTQTVTGMVLIAVQSALTGILAILIAANAIIMCVKENPHRRRRKEAEKLNRDLDNLTPLDARNSLLMDPTNMPLSSGAKGAYEHDVKRPLVREGSDDHFNNNESANPYAMPMRPFTPQERPFSPQSQHRTVGSRDSHENLMQYAAPLGGINASPPRQPAIPNRDGFGGNTSAGVGYRGVAY
jgi:large-conductance mechanosensitive channel